MELKVILNKRHRAELFAFKLFEWIAHSMDDVREVAERLGSGDGERRTLLTRQIAFEPLPASVLFVAVDCAQTLMCWSLKAVADLQTARCRHHSQWR